jgi:hypothetical protein
LTSRPGGIRKPAPHRPFSRWALYGWAAAAFPRHTLSIAAADHLHRQFHAQAHARHPLPSICERLKAAGLNRLR